MAPDDRRAGPDRRIAWGLRTDGPRVTARLNRIAAGPDPRRGERARAASRRLTGEAPPGPPL